MTAATEIARYNPSSGPRPAGVSQATAVEQQRAIAEVQAAVVVAQSCPRDMQSAEAEMEYVCGRMDMAEHAFYQVVNRGTGMSVHLARELARIWGNIDYGVKELHRSDERGESEVLAFAWDQQRNTRSSRSFIVPHQRMKAGSRVDLVDLQDIYLNNQNVGARAVRECIQTILPRWFTEKAQNLCRQTLEHGEGKPLADRVAAIIKAFKDNVGVTEQQLEQRLGKKRGQWDASDIAQLTIIGQSIKRGEIKVEDEFAPATTSTADEIASAPAEEKPKRTRKTKAQKEREETEAKTVEAEKAADAAEQQARDDASPGQGGGNDQSQGAEPSAGATHGQADSGDQDAADNAPEKTPMRKALENRHWGLIGNIEPKPSDDDRHDIYRSILKRPEVNSLNDLDDVEVGKVCEQLYQWGQDGVLNDRILDILMAADAAAALQQEGTQK
jgi:hypothetical protein